MLSKSAVTSSTTFLFPVCIDRLLRNAGFTLGRHAGCMQAAYERMKPACLPSVNPA